MQSVFLATTSHELRHALAGLRAVFVPTMGALHEGHAALIRHARQLAGTSSRVVVSIFVNPTQFAANEDLAKYPRQIDQDIDVCDRAGADVVFAPSVAEVYPAGLDRVAEGFIMPVLPSTAQQPQLEDRFRPTHFAGVCKVVARLFDIVQPACAVFGEKDYQQLRVIQDMVQQQQRWPELHIEPHPTMREQDGLAMSSRNVYLTTDKRRLASTLWNALQAASGERSPAHAEQRMHAMLTHAGFAVDYAAVRDASTLMPVDSFDHPCRALIAARIGTTRLIDNTAIGRVS